MNKEIAPLSGREFTFLGIISNVINWILWLTGALAVIYLIYGGIIYITAAGNEEKVKTGKNAVLYAIIGLVVVALSLAIINWIINIIQAGGQ